MDEATHRRGGAGSTRGGELPAPSDGRSGAGGRGRGRPARPVDAFHRSTGKAEYPPPVPMPDGILAVPGDGDATPGDASPAAVPGPSRARPRRSLPRPTGRPPTSRARMAPMRARSRPGSVPAMPRPTTRPMAPPQRGEAAQSTPDSSCPESRIQDQQSWYTMPDGSARSMTARRPEGGGCQVHIKDICERPARGPRGQVRVLARVALPTPRPPEGRLIRGHPEAAGRRAEAAGRGEVGPGRGGADRQGQQGQRDHRLTGRREVAERLILPECRY
jgi:hypothetical protein